MSVVRINGINLETNSLKISHFDICGIFENWEQWPGDNKGFFLLFGMGM